MASYTPANLAELGTIRGDEAAETYGDIDIGGNLLFDYAGKSRNKDIDRKNAQIAQLRSQLGEDRFNEIRKTVAENGGDWSQLGLDIFGEDGNKLDDFYSDVQGRDQNALQDLLGTLDQYQDPAKLFDRPDFLQYFGDVKNAAIPSARTMAGQQRALSRYDALSNPTETAQEKLLRTMATREMEANMRGDREAMARSLKARGVYGSGAEITGNLMSQAEHANRRSLENMEANAQASKRAMDALGSFSDLTSKMRDQEANEGSLANQVAEFNNQTRQNTSNLRGVHQVAAQQNSQNAIADRAGKGFNANRDTNAALRDDTRNANAAKTNFTQGKTGINTQGTSMLVGAYDKEAEDLARVQAANEAKRSTGGLFG